MFERKLQFISLLVLILLLSTLPLGDSAQASKDNPVVVMETDLGSIKIELYENDAPITVENFINYVEDDFYDGLIFHRVIEGFMVQGGGFEPGMNERSPTYSSIENEAEQSRNRNRRGTVAMARTDDPHSATSQFFINHDDNDFLDWDQAADGYGYCVFGRVIDGMDVVDEIASVDTTTRGGHEDVPVEDIIIREVKMFEERGDPFYTNILFIQVLVSIIIAGVIIAIMHYKKS